MKRHFLSGDELFDTESEQVTMAVLSPVPVVGRIRVLDVQRNIDHYVELGDLRARIGAGNLKIQRKGDPLVPAAYQDDEQLDIAQQTAIRLSRMVSDLTTSKCISANQAYRTLKAQHEDAPNDGKPFPSRATLYRYLEKRRNGVPALIGNKNKGNRLPRYSESVTAMVCKVAEESLLKPSSRWTVRSLTQLVNQVAHDEQLLGPTSHISRKYVLRAIQENLSSDIELDRLDPRTAAAAKSLATKRIRVSAPLMRVEQDGLHLPWVIRTPHGETRNLYLVHAIDCHTGIPVGWHFVVGSPTVSDSLRCVESILFSKKERFAALGLDLPMDCYGTPALVVWDNGPETKGERMQRLTKLGIDAMHCKSRHAHGKPYIERLNRSLKEALETLPGCTRFDEVDGRRDPKELQDLPMTLAELEKWVVRWYFETWANTELRRHVHSVFTEEKRLGTTPWQRWKTVEQEQGYALPLPPELDAWRMTLYEHEVRTLSRKTGITYKQFNFKGDNLRYLIAKHGETEVQLLVDPEDFRRIYVSQGASQPLIELVNEDVDEVTPAYSFEQAKQMVKAASDGNAESEEAAAFKRDVFARSRETSAKAAAGGSKKVKQSRETAARVKAVKAIDRARDNPLPPARTVHQASTASPVAASFDDVAALPVLNRKTGDDQA